MYPASRIGALLAHSDRYSLIRSFFTRPRPPPPLIRTISPPSYTASFTQPISALYSSRSSHYKLFSTRATSHSPEPLQPPQHSTTALHQQSSNLDITHHDVYDNNYPRFFRTLAQS